MSGTDSPRQRAVIPFYGAENQRLFAIERRSMDRNGRVIQRLNELLPAGRVLDIGAGDGFTAERLSRPDRVIVPLEPAAGMIDGTRALPWVQGVAQHLPFPDGSFDAAYATWAYFFPSMGHGEAGLTELNRVVRPGGIIVIVDNAGDDEFLALADDPEGLSNESAWWTKRGFETEIVASSFGFDSLEEARELMSFYFGEPGKSITRTTFTYRVAFFTARSTG
jgi:ubiquinone/menaquinone biosynthesis C-methylase UbiE